MNFPFLPPEKPSLTSIPQGKISYSVFSYSAAGKHNQKQNVFAVPIFLI
jgi:hypothetical protein